MKRVASLSALSEFNSGTINSRDRADSKEASRMTLQDGRRALLQGVFVFFALAACCYLVVNDPPAWREIVNDPSCLPEHRCDAL
jgi:hypothetical protein